MDSTKLRSILISIPFILLYACDDVIISDREVDSVQQVLNYYGGVCQRNIGFAREKGESKSYFELEMSESKPIEGIRDFPEVAASNVAYIFFSNMGNEINNYSHVRVKLNYEEQAPYSGEYSVKKLASVAEFDSLFQRASDYIRTQNFTQLITLLDSAGQATTEEEQLGLMSNKMDSVYGEITASYFQGFSFFEAKEGRELIHIAGTMQRTKRMTPISLVIDPASKEILTIKFKW